MQYTLTGMLYYINMYKVMYSILQCVIVNGIIYLQDRIEGSKCNCMNIQIKKGVLELCVLAMLESKDRYGYEMVSEISKKINMADGTIYPLLKRLKDDEFVTTYLVESQEGPPRKYYKISETGKKEFEGSIKEWHEFSESVNLFLKEAKIYE